MRLRRELDKRRKAGRPEKLAPADANSGKSAADTADLLGTSSRKIEKARTVDDHASPDIKAAVDSGDMSINAAYNATQAERRFAEAFDGMTPDDRKALTLYVEGVLRVVGLSEIPAPYYPRPK